MSTQECQEFNMEEATQRFLRARTRFGLSRFELEREQTSDVNSNKEIVCSAIEAGSQGATTEPVPANEIANPASFPSPAWQTKKPHRFLRSFGLVDLGDPATIAIAAVGFTWCLIPALFFSGSLTRAVPVPGIAQNSATELKTKNMQEQIDKLVEATKSLEDSAKQLAAIKNGDGAKGIVFAPVFKEFNDPLTNKQWEQILPTIKNIPKEKLDAFGMAAKSLLDGAKSDKEKEQILLSLRALLVAPSNHRQIDEELNKYWAMLRKPDGNEY